MCVTKRKVKDVKKKKRGMAKEKEKRNAECYEPKKYLDAEVTLKNI